MHATIVTIVPHQSHPPMPPANAANPAPEASDAPLVGVIMGSKSDWPTMMHTSTELTAAGIPHECVVVSAHRTPDWLFEYASTAQSRGLVVIVAGAGGAAHLPGMTAAKTVLPVIGVPIESSALGGLDSLLSIVQMPAGVPVATVPIGERGARSAGILAGMIVAISHPHYQQAVLNQRSRALAEAHSHHQHSDGASA